tara:strand:- start:155 stop:511 length:357 start_codon:yes stop_codon:yes gene_type:complete
MANKLLIFIGEKQAFDVDALDRALSSIPRWTVALHGPAIGARSEYLCVQDPLHELIVRISPDAETVTIDGDFDTSLAFALALQTALPTPLRMIDMGYNFDLALTEFGSSEELRSALAS